ncbi:hypothetical protein FQN57_006814 [Myotisia sp. PD_48]|nr:hypothetical protein FQN57_006814 [Myotisia sp. PD_48]
MDGDQLVLEHAETELARQRASAELSPPHPTPVSFDLGDIWLHDWQQRAIPMTPPGSFTPQLGDGAQIPQFPLPGDGSPPIFDLPDLTAMDGLTTHDTNSIFSPQITSNPLPQPATPVGMGQSREMTPNLTFSKSCASSDGGDELMNPEVSMDFQIESGVKTPELNALNYAICTFAVLLSGRYPHLEELCYHRARKELEKAELGEDGANFLSIEAVQAAILISFYELRRAHFARAWMTTGRVSRLVEMLGLQLMDSEGNNPHSMDSAPKLPPTSDPEELEERRRTFWAAFALDCFSSVGSGKPMTISDIERVSTYLPSVEFLSSETFPPTTVRLREVMGLCHNYPLSPFASVVVMAAILGRCLVHIRCSHDRTAENMNYDFWSQHSILETSIHNSTLALNAFSPAPTADPNQYFLGMVTHTATSFLHQAAIARAETTSLPDRMIADSKKKCLDSAVEVANIIRVAVKNPTQINPFVTLCLFNSSQILVREIKGPELEARMLDALESLLRAMDALKATNPSMAIFAERVRQFMGCTAPIQPLSEMLMSSKSFPFTP